MLDCHPPVSYIINMSEPAGPFIGADNVEPFSFRFVAVYAQHLHWYTKCTALMVYVVTTFFTTLCNQDKLHEP